MALTQAEIDAIHADLNPSPDDPPKLADPPSDVLEQTKEVLGNGLKVALVAGSILGAGFLLWRWREGSRADDEASTLRALEAGAPPAPALGMGAPSAHCSCGGAPEAVDLNDFPELREKVLRRLRS